MRKLREHEDSRCTGKKARPKPMCEERNIRLIVATAGWLKISTSRDTAVVTGYTWHIRVILYNQKAKQST